MTTLPPANEIHDVPALPSRRRDANKGDRGKILIIGGCRGMSGAPCLAARGATRGGAGLVRVAVPFPIWDIVAGKLDECLTEGLSATEDGKADSDAFHTVETLAHWADVLVMGPGMGQHPATEALIHRIVSEINMPMVLDADALNAFRDNKLALIREAQQKFTGRPVVLTPHPGEMSRLLGKSIPEIQSDRVSAVRAAALNGNVVAILKGAGTLVADATRIYTNTSGNPGMATGGTGDVLSGLVAALHGQGLPAFEATCLAVYLHGLAGDLAADSKSEWSMTAGDLVENLPAAFKKHSSVASKTGL